MRYWRDGREGMLSLGTWLRDARAKRAEARKLLAAGGDPSKARKTDKAAPDGRTLDSLKVRT